MDFIMEREFGQLSRTETATNSGSDSEDLYSSDSEILQSGLLKDASVRRASLTMDNTGSSLWEQVSSSLSITSKIHQPPEEDPVLTRQELIRLIHLRRHVEQLRKNLEEKEAAVYQLREQLTRCREHISNLLSQESSLDTQITEKEEVGHKAALGMLRSQLTKVKSEINTEEQVEQDLLEKLLQTEMDLSQARLSSSKFDELEDDLVRGEDVLKVEKGKQAGRRLQAETRLLMNAERSRKAAEMQYENSVQEQDTLKRNAIEQAGRAQEQGKVFLHETMERHRQVEAREREKERNHLEERVKAILSLKNNTESAKGTIQAQQLLKKEKDKKQKLLMETERERIITAGGNPDEVFLRRKRLAEFEKSREDFKKKQQQRQLNIVSQLLEEEKVKKRMDKLYSKPHWSERQEATHPMKTAAQRTKRLKRQTKNKPIRSHNDDVIIRESEYQTGTQGGEIESSDEDVPVRQEEKGITLTPLNDDVLAEPEIRGLWEEPLVFEKQLPEDGVKREMSKAELEMMKTAMDKLRKSVVVKQVAAGREFKGRPFISKPEEVIFNDFDVGKTYHKRLQLTNISYTVNYCRLVGVTDSLKDFITIEFNPPGSMSAGITCSMVVTFKPKLNTDLEGCIELLSQTGPFSIPVKCLTKRCVIACEEKVAQFGEVCIGETVQRSVTLYNKGALSTKFTLARKQPMPPELKVVSKSLVSSRSDAASDSSHLSERSHLSIMSTMEVSPSRMALTVTESGGELKSRSMGDLSSISRKSLSWKTEQGKVQTEKEDTPANQPDEASPADQQGDVPSNQLEFEVVIEKAESQVSSSHGKDTTTHEEQPLESAIAVGRLSEGEIPPFSSRTLELIFAPKTATHHRAEFQLTFSDPSVHPVIITASGCSTDLPVYMEKETLDLRICMLGRLYQDSLVLHNRATTALRVTFVIPSQLQPHFEVLPEQGLIQGESSFAAQLKFLPQENIYDGKCNKFLDPTTGNLSVPIQVIVAGQTTPVAFTVTAQVTSCELQFSPGSIDFGPCTTHESVVASLQITNQSILPQSFGFIHLPMCVEVQPNDGFGQILPRESLTVDVIFSAKKPKEYSFELTCKTGIDKTYKLKCHGTGVLPALELSENAINFIPTALNDVSTASLSVCNPVLSRLNSAVIRGAVQPQGTKSFEFIVPTGFPITVCPQVGVVKLGESVSVQVQFSPKLVTDQIQEEALRVAKELLPPPNLPSKPEETDSETLNKKKSKRQPSRAGNKTSLPTSSKTSLASSSQTKASSSDGTGGGSKETLVMEQHVDTPKEGSALWWKACTNLLSSYENSYLQLSIPCFVSSSAATGVLTETPSYRPEDTLYLEMRAPIVRPGLVVISDNGCTTIDLGSVGTGDSSTCTVTLKNISNEQLHLSSSLLDPHGPFEVRNALRDLPPAATHNLAIKFSPITGGKYYEPLKLYYGHASSLELRLKGVAVKPQVSLSLENGSGTHELDMGHVMAGDTITKTLHLHNSSPLDVKYSITLESLEPRGAQRNDFRASNYNSQPPFYCKPQTGVIEGGASCELGVSFSPDHQSLLYSDLLEVELNGQRAYTVQVCGKAWKNNMYVLENTQPLDVDQPSLLVQPNRGESMAVIPLPDGHTPPPTPVVLLLVHHVGEEGDSVHSSAAGVRKDGSSKTNGLQQDGVKVVKEIEIGCVKAALVKKTTGEFVIDPIPTTNPNAKAFIIDPMKSSVEAGSSKTVTIMFHPPKEGCSKALEAETNLTLKGDSVEVYRLLLRGLVCE